MKTSISLSGRRAATMRLLLAAWLAIAMCVVLGLAAPPTARADSAPPDPDDPRTPVTVTADELPTPQIDGVVWTMAMVDDIVYVGGEFTTARPAGATPGQSTVARSNIMAFDVTTGQMTSFAPTFNQQVRSIAVSPDKRRIYVGGDFTTVNGQARQRIAAFDAATGDLVPNFAPQMNYHVRAITATNTTVFVGGNFSGVGSANRGNLAAFNAASGALLDWAPQATGGTVDAITINPQGTKVAVGGGFTALNGSSNPGYGLGMVDAVTGASLPFAANEYVRNGTTDGAIDTLSTDGTYIYGGGWTFGKSGGSWEGVFAASWDDGKVHWLNDCHGDTYGVYPVGDVIYVASHTHYCENIDGVRQGAGGVGDYPYYRAVAFGREVTGTASWEPDQRRYYSFEGQPTSSMLGWFPSINTGTYTGQFQGPWSVVGNSDYVVMGGEFTRVNGVSQQGLTRFTVADKAPNDKGPTLFNATYPLNVRSTEAGQVRVNWRTNEDIDNEYLTYRVYRDTQTAAGRIDTRTVRARFWDPYTMGITDTGLTPGSTHQYRVVVTDPFGNVANSPWTSVTVASSGTDSDYVKAVYENEPTDYWRMGDIAGTTIEDTVGFHPLTTAAGVTGGAPGAIRGDSSTAATFDGTAGFAATSTQGNPPDVFTVEAWFRTTTTAGGRIVGWSNRNTATRASSKHDRQLYMDNEGHIHFGVKPNADRQVVTSPGTYNDGTWHHVVGSLSKGGMTLYLDGQRVGSRDDVTVGEHLSLGYWRIGGDTVTGWPSAPTSGYFAGDIDEVAIYKTELSAADVAAHHAAGAGAQTPNAAPTAAFTATTDGLAVSADGTASSDSDGTVASYGWTFGDGGTATGATATHTYATGGTFDVALTVTDNDGATNTLTKQVTVAAANVAPTAAFTATTDGLAVSADGTASSDSDGTVASYGWTFGDGGTATGATATHTYATGGTFDVALTVTDNDGATNTLTKQVTVADATGQVEVSRVSGADRYAVAANVSATQFTPGVPVVYIASGQVYPDGLTGAPLAAAQGGPVLLVQTSSIPSATASELSRLRPGRIVVLGGTGTVNDSVLTALRGYTSGAVTRIGGVDRYEVSVNVSRQLVADGAAVPRVYVASGGNFPDALAGAPVAARDGSPILLAPPSPQGVLPRSVADELTRLGADEIVILGGPASVTTATEATLRGYAPTVRRGGADRYGVAVGVSAAAFSSAETVFVATGMTYADTLTGAPVAGLRQAPILLVPTGSTVPSAVLDEIRRLGPARIVILGGPASVTPAQEAQLGQL